MSAYLCKDCKFTSCQQGCRKVQQVYEAEIEDLQTRLGATEKDRDAYKQALGHTEAALAKWGDNDDMADLKVELVKLQTKLDAAEKALEKHGKHHWRCPSYGYKEGVEKCTCGFTEALSKNKV